MRERDKPHSYWHKPSAPMELLTHGHGDEEVDGEVQPGVEEMARRQRDDGVVMTWWCDGGERQRRRRDDGWQRR